MKFLVALLVAVSALVAQQPENEAFAPDRIEIYKQVDGPDLSLQIFLPSGWSRSDSRPAIVFFFGGGWVSGDPAQFHPHARYFAQRGVVAACAWYRTKNSHGTDPFAAIADGKSAMRWLRMHALEWGIDPGRIVAAGGSAGGHVAASTALLQGLDDPGDDPSVSSTPSALVLFNPVIDTTEKGYGVEKVGERKLEASPVHHVRGGLAPTIIFHGTADTTVPFENVERFCSLMIRAGNRCELVPYDGEKHGFFNYSRNVDHYLDTVGHANEFLRSVGIIP